MVSLLQTAGRVNRHNSEKAEIVWTITLKEEGLLKKHPGMRDSSKVLLDLIAAGYAVSPALCTDALKREIRLAGAFSDSLLKTEEMRRFPQVEKEFRVIASDTRIVVVDNEIISRLESHLSVDWRDVQRASVQIWGYRLDDLQIPEIYGRPGIYKWTYTYDSFIGYMSGVLAWRPSRPGSGMRQ